MCTGFSDMLIGDNQRVTGIRQIIMKPYAINHLANAIRDVLERRRNPDPDVYPNLAIRNLRAKNPAWPFAFFPFHGICC